MSPKIPLNLPLSCSWVVGYGGISQDTPNYIFTSKKSLLPDRRFLFTSSWDPYACHGQCTAALKRRSFHAKKMPHSLGQVGWMGAVVFAVSRNALRQTYILDDIGLYFDFGWFFGGWWNDVNLEIEVRHFGDFFQVGGNAARSIPRQFGQTKGWSFTPHIYIYYN